MFLKSKFFSLVIATLLIVLIIVFPDISSGGVSRGLLISANVIIPSLFPFMVCVLILVKSGFNVKIRFVNNVLYQAFGHNFEMFFAFLLSMLGGYPVGARLINELHRQKVIDKKTADVMLMYCVNAGPAFIISVVGKGVFSSYKIGLILLMSHITSSVVMAIFCGIKLKKFNCQYLSIVKSSKTFSENLVESVADACSAIISICSYVILFSCFNAYLDFFFGNVTIIKYISYFTEVTSAVTKTKSIIFIAFLLGFAGLSIWCQIFAMSVDIKINFLKFSISRILHGTISSIIAKFAIDYFGIKLLTFNNNVKFSNDVLYSDMSVSISLLIMLIMLIIFIYTKNCSGKIIKDVI